MISLRVAFVIIFAVVSTACGMASPDPGFDAVLVRKPWFFGSGGVDPQPVRNTTAYIALSTSVVPITMQPHQYSIRFDDLFTSDGVPLDFEANVRVRVTDSVRLVKEFGLAWFTSNVEQSFRELVRDEVKRRRMEAIVFGDGRDSAGVALDEFVNKAAKTAAEGTPWEVLGVALGRANPPEGISGQRAETARMILRQETEKEGKKAEDERKAREESRAAADRAYNERIGITASDNVEIAKLRVISEACAKGGCNVFIGGGAIPTLSVK